jgi:hypothetical protein
MRRPLRRRVRCSPMRRPLRRRLRCSPAMRRRRGRLRHRLQLQLLLIVGSLHTPLVLDSSTFRFASRIEMAG